MFRPVVPTVARCIRRAKPSGRRESSPHVFLTADPRMRVVEEHRSGMQYDYKQLTVRRREFLRLLFKGDFWSNVGGWVGRKLNVPWQSRFPPSFIS